MPTCIIWSVPVSGVSLKTKSPGMPSTLFTALVPGCCGRQKLTMSPTLTPLPRTWSFETTIQSPWTSSVGSMLGPMGIPIDTT